MSEFNVAYPVSQIYQPTPTTCWAASTAMLANYRDGTALDAQAVVERAHVVSDGATPLALATVAQIFDFSQIRPPRQTADSWANLLGDNGPLLVQVPGHADHSIVVSGAYDDGSGCQIHVNDPIHGDMWLPYEQFEQAYALAGTGWSDNVYRS